MIKTILLDIEGTTTPIDFVHKVLFPFAADRVESYVATHFAKLSTEIAQLAAEHSADAEYGFPFNDSSPDSVSDYLRYLIEIDRKSTPLKFIQGMIWQEGFEAGELKSEMFADVPAAFARWREQGKAIAIYSSGSVLAQKLLFKYTAFGKLTPFISSYFDTNTGGKREAQSYRRIADLLGLEPATILFVSDIPEELNAASEAGVSVVLSVRPGNEPVEGNEISRTITSLLDLF